MPRGQGKNTSLFGGSRYSQKRIDRLSKSVNIEDNSNLSRQTKGRGVYRDVTRKPDDNDSHDNDDITEVPVPTLSQNNFVVRAQCANVDVRFGSAKPPSNGKSVDLKCYKCSFKNAWKIGLVNANGGDGDITITSNDVDTIRYFGKLNCRTLVLVLMPKKKFAAELSTKLCLNRKEGKVLDPTSAVRGARAIVINMSERESDDTKRFRQEFEKYFKFIEDLKMTEEEAKEFISVAAGASDEIMNGKMQAVPGLSVDAKAVQGASENPANFTCEYLGIANFLKKKCFLHLSDKMLICPNRFNLTLALRIRPSFVAYFQLDDNQKVLVMDTMGNIFQEIQDKLTEMSSDCREEMLSASRKSESVKLRILFPQHVDTHIVRQRLLSQDFTEAPCPSDLFSDAFRELKQRADVTGVDTDIRSGANVTMQTSLQSSNLNKTGSRRNIPPPSIVGAPKVTRTPQGTLQSTVVNTSTFEAAEKTAIKPPDTCNAAREAEKKRGIRADSPPRSTNKKPKLIPDDDEFLADAENARPNVLQIHSGTSVRRGGIKPIAKANASRVPLNEKTRQNQIAIITRTIPRRPFPQLDLGSLVTAFGTLWEKNLSNYDAFEKQNASKNLAGGRRTRTGEVPKQASSTSNEVSNAASSQMVILSDDDGDDFMDADDAQICMDLNQKYDLVAPEGCHEVFHNLHHIDRLTVGLAEVAAADLFQLAKGQQLGDGLIQFMIEWIKYMLNPEDRKNIYIFSYFFFQTYMGVVGSAIPKSLPEKVLKRIATHTEKAKIFTRTHVVVPILYEYHWYLAIICHPNVGERPSDQQSSMVILDSLLGGGGCTERQKYTFGLLQVLFESLYEKEFGQHQSFGPKEFPRIVVHIPQQQNGVDCGVFLIQALAMFIRDKPVFVSKQQPGNKFSGTRPKIPDWFENSSEAVEKMRLLILHSYNLAASWSRHFVYRTDYLPGITDEIGEEVDALSLIEDNMEPIVLSDSPQKEDPKAVKTEVAAPLPEADKSTSPYFGPVERPVRQKMSKVQKLAMDHDISVEVASILFLNVDDTRVPELKQHVRNLDAAGALSKGDHEFWMCCGWLLRPPLPEEEQRRLNIKAVEQFKKQSERRRNKNRNPPPEPVCFVRKNAKQLWQEFLDM